MSTDIKASRGRRIALALGMALLVMGAAAWDVAARADEPAKELTAEERGKLAKEAANLDEQVDQLYPDEKYAAALELAEKSLSLRRKLYPADKFSGGHPDLANSLNNVGVLLGSMGEYAKAEPYYRDALALRRKLYPADKFPKGHPDLAQSLNNMGFLLKDSGEYAKAEPYYREALEMYKKLYPAAKYPAGYPDLALSLNNMGFLLQERSEYDKAEPYYREALEMRKKLYPADKYPAGHPDLAVSLANLGVLLQARGQYGKAEPFYQETLEMRKKLYPTGHPDLVISFNNLGTLLYDQGEYARAEPYYRDALAMNNRLYPADKYPDGHRDLALSLHNLGAVFAAQRQYDKAEPYYRDALEISKRLYPADKYPDGHSDLATNYNYLGLLLKERGEHDKAERYYRQALEMRQRLYPADKYPDGHDDLAMSLCNLGSLLSSRGEYSKAAPLLRDAMEMYKRLYSGDKYPDGHPYLATSINHLADLLEHEGEYGKAEQYFREALEMRKRLYPADKYPNGHPDLAMSLQNLGLMLDDQGEYDKAELYDREALEMYKRLYPGGHPDLATSFNNRGMLLKAQGEYDKAAPFFRDALEMRERLYSTDKYPNGHPDLAVSLNNWGVLFEAQQDYGKAELYYRDALEMNKRLYPADKYPAGHPDLARSLNNMGALLQAQGEYAKAADVLAEATSMYARMVAAFADAGSEAEALNLAASLPGTRDMFLAATAHAEGAKPAGSYSVMWQGKSALARGLQRRRRLLRAVADADEATRRKVQTLIGVRQDLARLVLAPARPGDADRAQLVHDLADKKERLEKELAALLPASDRGKFSYSNLTDHLPDHAAFIDLYRYADWDSKTRKWGDDHYAAFVLRKGQPIRRVEIADAAAIDKDLAEWRSDIVKDLRSDAAIRLRKAVWEPIAAALGEGVDTIYVCPDGPLSALPWSALPGDRPGSVLLEDYAFAVTPGGPSLLDQLTDPAPARRGPGVLLAVGGVRYDRDDKLGKPWPSLPATDKERAAVVAEAGKLPHPPEIVERSGAGADVPRLLADLPKARWAHLATHGFFAAPDSKEREHLFRPDDFLMGVGSERRGAAARNPLTLSGLVLAGANQPTDADSGVLTGEAVAGLDLDGMDLAVLSACQTGLGEAAAGEGVFGLQRAFHIGGAKNVVASLWSVDDAATAALMNLFYYHLWEKNEPPLQALHHAQLELYRNPQGIAALAKGRGAVDWDETVETVTKAPVSAKETPKRAAAVKDWAAFVLSGAGR